MNIGKLVFYLFLYLHWLACFFNFCVSLYGPHEYYVGFDKNYRDLGGEVLKNFNKTVIYSQGDP
jgi:hypothetical protein